MALRVEPQERRYSGPTKKIDFVEMDWRERRLRAFVSSSASFSPAISEPSLSRPCRLATPPLAEIRQIESMPGLSIP